MKEVHIVILLIEKYIVNIIIKMDICYMKINVSNVQIKIAYYVI